MRPVEHDAQEAFLAETLRDHPQALISAVDHLGRLVPLPPSLELLGHDVVQAQAWPELVDGASHATVIDVWERAKLFGAASAPVGLVNGGEATMHVIDVRHRHGVLVGMLVTESGVELLAALADRPAVLPKTGSVAKDATAVIWSADERIGQILGYEPAALVGMRSLDLIHPDEHGRAIDAWMEMLMAPGRTTRLRARHRRHDGTWLWMELTNTNRLESDEGMVVTEMLDISDEMAALESLRQREQLLVRLTEALPSGVLHVDRDRNVIYANARLRSVVGVDESTTLEAQLSTVIDEDSDALAEALDDVLVHGLDADVEVRLRIPGAPKLHLCTIAIRALTDAEQAPAGAVLNVDDVTEASELRAELERRATVDDLTGCLNRASVLRELDRVLRHHAAGSRGTAVVFLDLDAFKEVNDTYGHGAGDRLLTSVANRLQSISRAGDALGRLGGDEFIVVVPSIADVAEATEVGQRISAALTEPLEIIGGTSVPIRSSIGVAWSAAPDVTADALTIAADQAMYESKRAGTSQPVCVVVG